ncbi:uncharacterized protein LOC116005818 [Ipomoea triloba]|uniref:uncharacterized protein LOC116005818 n=1 Tax=Ipomoea triloba TaxID=35885 RepID=UPI00125E3E13|nr:uncharacterized protein LOC116005818 [Ipomoea triloba]
MVDTGSSVNVMYLEVFRKLQLDRSELTPIRTPLSGFTGAMIHPEGVVRLPVEVGTVPRVLRVMMEFVVVDLACVHNAILGRLGISQLGVIISMSHLCMKFQTPEGVGTVLGDPQSARRCYVRAVQKQDASTSRINTISKKKEDARSEQPEPSDDVELVVLTEDRPDRAVKIGAALPTELKRSIIGVLREYADIIAWGPEDMPGIDRRTICHRLSVRPGSRPVKQKQRHLSSDRRQFVREKTRSLAAAGHIREVQYPEWLANVVLNKACPLDPFPFPSIHQMVDETAGAELLSFMDAFKGYHQVMMAEEDEAKTAFITPDGLYCYRVMPFGLRSVGATYQRMVNALFGDLIGKTMEAYIDDMLVKSKDMHDHASDLRRSLEIMRRNQLRLNPAKCTFAVQTGKFLGFMMTRRGIEPNPAKVKPIMDMRPPATVREVQQLTGRLAALSRFLSKLAERAHPFFQTLKKTSAFAWTDDCQKAFESLKEYLASPIVLSRPEPGEELQIYLSASDRAISAVLCRTDPEGVQRPVYYISHALQGPELRYSRLEKVVFALYTTAKKLTPYFQGRVIRVLTDQPMGAILRTTTSSGQLVKWAMILTQFAIEYTPRPAIKGQALADFVVECSARDSATSPTADPAPAEWEIATDGSSCNQGAGAGIVLTSPEGFKVYYALSLAFSPTNNEAEYEAFIAGLCHARSLGARHVRIRTDSALVVGQVIGAFEAKGERLARYRDHALSVMESFDACIAEHIPRAENADVDMLSRLSHEAPEYISKVARVEELSTACIDVLPMAPVDAGTDEWISDLRSYLETGTLPENEQRAKKVKLRAPRFQIVDNRLYRRSYGRPLMRCLSRFEAELVMTELHSGLCSAHQGGRALARK